MSEESTQFGVSSGWHFFERMKPLLIWCCRLERRRYEWWHGKPRIVSAQGAIGLVQKRYRGDFWYLGGGITLAPGDSVFEMHVYGDVLLAMEVGSNWRAFVRSELWSLAPVVAELPETAIVGTTILRKQAVEFGAVLRELPDSLRLLLDTWFKRLLLFTFHPAGAKRMAKEKTRSAEAAIATRLFCELYGA